MRKFSFPFTILNIISAYCFLCGCDNVNREEVPLDMDAVRKEFAKKWSCSTSAATILPKVAKARVAYYDLHKYPILDFLTKRNGGKAEIKNVYVKTANGFTDLLDSFLKIPNVNGMRVYIGSKTKGGLVLIFVPTTAMGAQNVDYYNWPKNPYYIYEENGQFKKIEDSKAKELVHNYQEQAITNKRDSLYKTLNNGEKETKHIWFKRNKISDITNDIKCRTGGHASKLTGLKLRLASYTDAQNEDTIAGIPIEQKHKKRLTIDIAYTNSTGDVVYHNYEMIPLIYNMLNSVGFADIFSKKEIYSLLANPSRKNLENIINNNPNKSAIITMIQNSYPQDTGDPTPPPSNRMELLDLKY